MKEIEEDRNSNLNLEKESEQMLDYLGLAGESRRKFIGQLAAAGLSLWAMELLNSSEAFANLKRSDINGLTNPTVLENVMSIKLSVNQQRHSLEIDPRMTLLDSLREALSLTGTKKGCDHGQCGACTVLIDGKRVLSCLTLAATCGNAQITTIEGITPEKVLNGRLHPVQEAFIQHDGFQCGFCTPGQICSVVALLEEIKNGDLSYATHPGDKVSGTTALSDDEIRERMSGNICRCGAYPNILAAIKKVHYGIPHDSPWTFDNAGLDDRNTIPYF